MITECYKNCPWIKHLDFLNPNVMFSPQEIFRMSIDGAIRRDTQIQMMVNFLKSKGLHKELLKYLQNQNCDIIGL